MSSISFYSFGYWKNYDYITWVTGVAYIMCLFERITFR